MANHTPVAQVQWPQRLNVPSLLRKHLRHPKVAEAVELYLANGVATGHKVSDRVKVVEVIIAVDNEDGGLLRDTGLTLWQLSNKLMGVLGQVYVIDRITGKITNDRQLEHKPAATAAAA